MNTVLSLIGACLSAFALSAAYHGKLDMVHIQNSTLAGGVAIGSAANMDMAPAAALGVGMVAGTASVLGFRWGDDLCNPVEVAHAHLAGSSGGWQQLKRLPGTAL